MIRWATTRPAVMWAFGGALILAGGVAFTRLPLATKTTVELPRLTVSAGWYGASSELLETYVTSPIEAAIQGIRGVRKTTSTSGDGGGRGAGSGGRSTIQVDLEPGADVQLTRLAIHERLELLRKDFPPGVSAPQVSNYVPEELDEQPLLQYSLSGPYTPGTLSKLAEEQLRPRLTSVPGVSSVNSFGFAQLGVSVSYDVQRLRQLDISPALLAAALTGARMVQALGDERAGATTRTVVLRDQPHVYQDLERLPIRAPSGRVFLLGELASVRPEEDTRGAFSRLNGVPRVGVDITRLPGADAIHTARRVREAMLGIQQILPPGIVVKLESDESVALGKELRDLVLRGAIAFAAVTLVLLLGMRRIRPVLLVMGSAAIAIAGTALGLYLLKVPANLLTIAGLGMGIGILVQDGVVVVDRLRRVDNTAPARAAAGRRISRAVVGSTLTTLVVLFPFLYLQGNARAAFVPFAAAFGLGLIWSVFSSVVMIPAVGTGAKGETHWPRLHRFYLATLAPLVRWRWVTIGVIVAGLGVITWGFVKRVPRTSFGNWYGQRTTLLASLSFPRGSDPQSLDRGMAEFERIAVGMPGVEKVEARGSGGYGNVQVTFTKEAEMSAIPLQMQEEMTERGVLVGGAAVGVFGRGPGFSNGAGGSSGATYRIKLLGYSFGGVERLAKDLRDRLESIPRVRNVNINAASFWGSDRAVSVVLTPNRAALQRAGVTSGDFASAVSREINGAVGGQRLEFDGEEVPVSLKATGARERSLDELKSAIVPNAQRAPVRVSDLSEVSEREGLATINREDQQYVRIVSYDFRGPTKLANRTHEAFMKSLTAPAGYTISDQQFTWDEDDSGKGLWLVFAAGVTLVILAVAMVFDSVWAAAMVFLALPLCLAGVGAIFWTTKTSFTREAAVGVILVVGLAVHQAILIVDAALERRRKDGGTGSREDPAVRWSSRFTAGLTVDDVLAAAADRAGMITLVTLTTLASLIPLAVGSGSDTMFGSIALATAGGTITGTLGALWIVPAYLVGHRRKRASEPVST